MPINLSPCQSGPSKTEIDVRKLNFFPNNNNNAAVVNTTHDGNNNNNKSLNKKPPNDMNFSLPSIREIVKINQELRSTKDLEINKFQIKTEDTLMKFKTPVSSHNGAMMSIDGTHPYQMPSAKEKRKYTNGTRKLSLSGVPSMKSELRLASIKNWLYTTTTTTTTTSVNNLGNEFPFDRAANSIYEIGDEFNFDFNNGTDENINITSNHESTTIVTPIALPYAASDRGTSKHNTITSVVHKNGTLTKNKSEPFQEYKQYYGMALPLDYVNAVEQWQSKQKDDTNLTRTRMSQQLSRELQANHQNNMASESHWFPWCC
ncbi:hypothetical protein Kpol_1020p2 [Vanderwaltozyma polyspora DSM 70294]|uniref:Uncharacterized protein n=1 Tax=Vanderwaltozyma polyspora (strain ATCC 22028 / DSM 70294 / BCRC 21397 / CBS 2163 / NBRC 10782 / NRRL Y-8283 / UCD 57-17) TaxID=436907 RepID=A7TLB4_VANPO|nr:uncharacterized protein Kpol_1020p2 [Vanderwaltozyma polyspora DSM 70294]EDO16895.1 hypothetical protein Kpol_1020p2 [Vanderwaltozyma polyspora DSM 70294]